MTWVLVVVGLLVPFQVANTANSEDDCWFRAEPKGVGTVRGIVRDNDRGCDVDGTCVITIVCKGSEYLVVYGQGWYRGHVNSVIDIAGKVKPGDLIEAHGSYTASTTKKSGAGLNVFSNDSYWVKLIRSSSD